MKRLVLFCALMSSSILLAQPSLQSSDSGGSRTCVETIYSFSLSDSTICYKDTIKLERPIYNDITPYNLIGKVSISNSYEVRAYRYNGWEDEPGDFDVVSIYQGDSLIFEFSDPWIAFNKIPSEFKIFSSYPNDYFHIFEMDNGATAIILNGYGYGSQPPSLTVILLYQGSAHLLYYKERSFLINNITVSPGGYFEIELHDEVPSLDYIPNVYYLKATQSGMGLYK